MRISTKRDELFTQLQTVTRAASTRSAVQALSGVVRAEDVIARWGGEEFFVCAQHSDAGDTGVLAERLVRVVARDTAYVPIIRITFAVEDSIRLKAHVVDFHALQQRELLRAAMTRGAELLRQFIAAQ